MLRWILVPAAIAAILQPMPTQAEDAPPRKVGVVFHTITWTYENPLSIDKETVLGQADDCVRRMPRKKAEACLRRHGWKPAE